MERSGGRRTLKYLALGDSYTIGTGASNESHSWPSIIASRLNAQLTNPAVNGFTTLDLIAHELPLLQRLKPDFVTVLIGVNDLVQGRTRDQYRRSLSTIYDAVVGEKARVAAVSIPDWYYVPAAADFGGAEHVAMMTKVFNDIAHEEGTMRGFAWIDITDVSRSRIGSDDWIASDQLHPGDVQYAAWADEIWHVLSGPSGWQL